MTSPTSPHRQLVACNILLHLTKALQSNSTNISQVKFYYDSNKAQAKTPVTELFPSFPFPLFQWAKEDWRRGGLPLWSKQTYFKGFGEGLQKNLTIKEYKHVKLQWQSELMWLLSGSVPFTLLSSYIHGGKEWPQPWFSIAGCDEVEHHILLDVDVRRGVKRGSRCAPT